MRDIKEKSARAMVFLKEDIWRIQLSDLRRVKIIAIKMIRIILLAIRGFTEDKLPLRASALTFYSLLSLVPVLAMIFGIAKGFGFQNTMERRLMENFAGQEIILSQLMEAAHRLLDSTKGGVIAGLGIAMLFYTVIKLLSHIEKSFNQIWGIQSGRTLARKFSDYLSVMLIAPLLLMISGGVTVFISTKITMIFETIRLLGFFSPFVFALLKLLPLGVLWLLFTLVYILMPNTKVKFSSGVVAGVLAGTTVYLVQLAYLSFQIGAAKYNAIYGSFAALPLFLIWLQITWIIVLLGAKVAFAHQNVTNFEFEPDENKSSFHRKKRLSLGVTHHAVKRFAQGEPPQTASQMADDLQLPVRLVRSILNDLVDCRILSVVKTEDEKDPAFQPALDIAGITMQTVITALDHNGNDEIPAKATPEFDVFSKAVLDMDRITAQSPENLLIKDIP